MTEGEHLSFVIHEGHRLWIGPAVPLCCLQERKHVVVLKEGIQSKLTDVEEDCIGRNPRYLSRLERVLTSDPGMGVVRHVDADYDEAIEVAHAKGVKIPGVTTQA